MSSFPNSSSSSDATPAAGPYAWLADVPCQVDVVLGTARARVRESLAWQVETIVRLDQPSGTGLELRVEGIPVACGEVIVTDGGTGLRVTRILPPGAEEGA